MDKPVEKPKGSRARCGSPSSRETSRLAIETADFDIRSRQLALERQGSLSEELQRQVDGLAIAAPFDGAVASLAVQDRDAVAANQAIAIVVNFSRFEVEITLPENYAAEVTPGTAAQILYEGKEHVGQVTVMSPEIRDNQGHGTVAFEGAPPAGLRPGSSFQGSSSQTSWPVETKKRPARVGRPVSCCQ